MESGRDEVDSVSREDLLGVIHSIVVHGEHAFYAVQLLQLLYLQAVQVYPIAGGCFAEDGQTDDAVRRRIWIGIHQRDVDQLKTAAVAPMRSASETTVVMVRARGFG